MYYQRNLRIQLQERRNRLYKSVMETYQNELKYLLDFIAGTPYLNGLVKALLVEEPQVEWSKWKEEHFHSNRTFELPDNETALAKISYAMIYECAAEKNAAWQYGLWAAHGQSGTSSHLHAFTEIFAQPFFNYLHSRQLPAQQNR
jgi:hypothetical protein